MVAFDAILAADEAVALCQMVGLKPVIVKTGASHVAIVIYPKEVDLPDLIARLYRAMRDRQTGWYQVEHHLLPSSNTLDELRFSLLGGGV